MDGRVVLPIIESITMGRKKGKRIFISKVLLVLVLVLVFVGGHWVYEKYNAIYQPNINLDGKQSQYFFIPTGTSYDQLLALLYESEYVVNTESFKWVALQKNLPKNVHPGRYLVSDQMSNNALVNLLRSGNQVPVKVLIQPIRTKASFAQSIAHQIEADSSTILKSFNEIDDSEYPRWPELIIPNTYELYWNTSATEFMKRMQKEYNRFWNTERQGKAKSMGFSQKQVAVLASIVDQETYIAKEKPIIAGVYVNRIKRGMRLEADPTLIFAMGDFTIKRVLDIHKKIDSPYNTYRHTGLPPGPICMPTISALDGVLNYASHDYIFFCAKEDFSGYHNFARTYSQHRVNARKFRNELNKRRIWN